MSSTALSNDISVYEPVLERIKLLAGGSKETFYGFLYGIETQQGLFLAGCVHIAEGLKSGNFVDHFTRNRCLFPAGVDPVGVFLWSDDVHEISNVVPMSAQRKLPDSLLCLHGNPQGFHLYTYHRLTKQLNETQFTATGENLLEEHVTISLKTNVEITYMFSTKKAELHKNCSTAIQSVINEIKSPLTMYKVDGCNILIGSEDVIGVELSETTDGLLAVVRNASTKPVVETTSRKQKTNKEKREKVLYIELFKKLTQIAKTESTSFSPIIRCNKEEAFVVMVHLPIHAISLAAPTLTLGSLLEVFQRSVERQLEACQELLVNCEGTEIPDLESLLFQPSAMPFVLSILSRKQRCDKETVEWRRELHQRLMLLLDRPCFRIANRFQFPRDVADSSSHLTNPHLRLPSPGKGTIKTVSGRYHYYHYNQDWFNDDKWGCAYRSLQTLVSWFRLQGYTSKEVPTHRDIQQALVDIGDKEPNFVGSRQWIGSVEVSYVLDRLFSISSKIQFVSSGADLANKGRELLQHFETQGTPIMIGGGQLAHTILGVHYNELTGDINFLILDPHYIGPEDLNIVQEKGWCGWKDSRFWDSAAYYNMCMPQRPFEM